MRLHEIDTTAEDRVFEEIAHLLKKYFYLQQERDEIVTNAKEKLRQYELQGDDPSKEVRDEAWRQRALYKQVRDNGYNIGHMSANEFMEKHHRLNWYRELRTHYFYTASNWIPADQVDRFVDLNKQRQITQVMIEHAYRQIGVTIPL